MRITLLNMVEKKEIDRFINPRNKNDFCLNDGSYVDITREDYKNKSENVKIDVLEYKVCLSCKKSNYSNCVVFSMAIKTP